MAANYEMMPLAKQLEIMTQEAKNTNMLEAKSQMWKKAGDEIGEAAESMGKETNKIEPEWTDQAGKDFVERARNSKKVLDKWKHNITSSKVSELLQQLATLIPQTYATLQSQITAFNAWYEQNKEALTREGYSKEQAEIYPPYNWRRLPGGMMNQIAELYGRATKGVDTAASGGKYEGVNTPPDQKTPPRREIPGGTPTSPTGATPPTAGNPQVKVPTQDPNANPKVKLPTQDPNANPKVKLPTQDPNANPKVTTPTGNPQVTTPTGNPQNSPLGTNPTVNTPPGLDGANVTGNPGGQNPNPELSGGLGGAPVTAPTLPTGPTGLPPGVTGGVTPPIIPTGPTTGTPGVSNPILNRPIGGGPGGGPGGGGPGSVGGAGVKLPGVSLGGVGGGGAGVGGGGVGGVGGAGNTTIPAAAAPVQAPVSAPPASAGAVAPPGLTSAPGTPATGTGGMPPMMPPMGMGGAGAGIGGGGGTPGSGAASRTGNNGRNNRRKDVVTPGLPVMLSGKAGWADLNAFAGRGRRQVEESDVPTTVQLIDEDLWQVEQKPAADERVAAPVRRAH